MKPLFFISLLLSVSVSVTAQNTNQDSLAISNTEQTVNTDSISTPITFPQYGENENDLFDFLRQNMRYPKEVKKKNISGKVIVSFVIEKDGSISNIEVSQKSPHPLLDQEAVRLVKLMNKWKPGYSNGEPIRVKFQLPITFRLTGPPPKKTEQEL